MVNHDPLAGLPIITNESVRRLRAELRAGDVLDANDPAVGGRADDNVVEFLDRGQPPLGADVQLKLDLRDEGRSANAADRGLRVLRVDRVDDIGGGNIEARHAVQVEPNAHRVFEIAPLARVANPGHPLQRVYDVDLGVVGEKQRVAGSLWRVDSDDLQQRGRLLLGRNPVALHLGRQLRQRLVDAVGDVDGVEVGVTADLESDVKSVTAVAAGGGLHIDHSVDAVDLGFDDLGDALFNGCGRGARIHCAHRDLRRHNVGKLRDGKRTERDHAGDRNDDRDDNRKARSVDEDGGNHCSVRPCQPAGDDAS